MPGHEEGTGGTGMEIEDNDLNGGSNVSQEMGTHRQVNDKGDPLSTQTLLTPRPLRYLDCTYDDVYKFNQGRASSAKLIPWRNAQGYFIPPKPDLSGVELERHIEKFSRWAAPKGEYAEERVPINIKNNTELSNKEYARKLGLEYGINGFYLAAGRNLNEARARLKEAGHDLPDPSDTRPHRVYFAENVDWAEIKERGLRLRVDDKLFCPYLPAGSSLKAVAQWRPVTSLAYEDSSMAPVPINITTKVQRDKLKVLGKDHEGVSYYQRRFQYYARAGSNLKPLRDAGFVTDNDRAVDASLPLAYEKTRAWSPNKAIAMGVRRAGEDFPPSYETIPGRDPTVLIGAKLLAVDGAEKMGRTTAFETYKPETSQVLERARTRNHPVGR